MRALAVLVARVLASYGVGAASCMRVHLACNHVGGVGVGDISHFVHLL